jgi:hypothetical protein
MRRKPNLTSVLLLILLVVFPGFAPFYAVAQDTIPTAEQLDQLLAPVALYPDSLLAQITTASTNPQEILDVSNWLEQNHELTGTALTDAAEKAGFDPAFIALVNFPQVVEMMAQHVDDYAAIGQAFSADQASVTDSIQRLRSQAHDSGALRDTPQQRVEVQQEANHPVYVIQPVEPKVVYVPVYDPTIVYVRPISATIVTTSWITFGVGIGIGTLLVDRPWGWAGWGWNWGARRVYYNRVFWVGWGNPYRPPRPWYRPRPVIYANRPGYGGNWHYRPKNYRPPKPGYKPGYGRPPYQPGNRPGYRPGTNPPGSTKPTRPTVQPTRPGPSRPPATKPNRPPATKPTTLPAPKPTQPPQGKPQPKPAPKPNKQRPAAKPKPEPPPTPKLPPPEPRR